MREYKFRVWDKENKEMLYQGSNTTHNNGVMDCRIVLDELGFDVLGFQTTYKELKPLICSFFASGVGVSRLPIRN
jgi:hypothetical protein